MLNQLVRAYEENSADESGEDSDAEGASEGESGEEENSEAGNPEVTLVSDGEDVLDDEKEVKVFQRLIKKAGGGTGGEEESSESSDLESGTLQKTEFESEYETLVDVEIDYDEFVAFKALLQSLNQQNAPIYSLLVSQVGSSSTHLLQCVFLHGRPG